MVDSICRLSPDPPGHDLFALEEGADNPETKKSEQTVGKLLHAGPLRVSIGRGKAAGTH
jgi:hypothetical protein